LPPTEIVRTPFDPEAQKRREAQTLATFESAELAAADVNARVAALFETMRSKRSTTSETSIES
jgi:hypothetical protein